MGLKKIVKKASKKVKKVTKVANKIASVTNKAGSTMVKVAPFIPPPGDSIVSKGGAGLQTAASSLDYAADMTDMVVDLINKNDSSKEKAAEKILVKSGGLSTKLDSSNESDFGGTPSVQSGSTGGGLIDSILSIFGF